MTTATRETTRSRWALAFLAALVAVAATIFGAVFGAATAPTSASAATTSTAETRVEASAVSVGVLVGPAAHIGAGQRIGEAGPGPGFVVATGVAANAVTRSLDDAATLRGATAAEVEGLIPSGWVKSATSANKGGLGTRYSNPERLGEQIRIMPGKVTDPNPLKQGPYARISRDGTVSDPIPLYGNPTL